MVSKKSSSSLASMNCIRGRSDHIFKYKIQTSLSWPDPLLKKLKNNYYSLSSNLPSWQKTTTPPYAAPPSLPGHKRQRKGNAAAFESKIRHKSGLDEKKMYQGEAGENFKASFQKYVCLPRSGQEGRKEESSMKIYDEVSPVACQDEAMTFDFANTCNNFPTNNLFQGLVLVVSEVRSSWLEFTI